tara:strand:- start:824 stop:1546 length:723 start_codon:yes stop_codon:yes gene_type:complete
VPIDPSLEGKKIAIIGLGASQIDYVISVENSKEWDEVWCINSALSVFECDRVFMMDPASRYLDTEDAGNQTDVMRRLLPTFDKPIYSCEMDERVAAIVEYPLAEVVETTRCAYLNTTVSYSIAFGLFNKVKHMDLFGMDFSYKHNLHFAEAGRACVEFWICKCIEAGIGIGTSPRSSLLDSNVEIDERLYGYHRLDDPVVAMPDPAGQWVVCHKSRLADMVEKHNLQTVELPSAPEPYKG